MTANNDERAFQSKIVHKKHASLKEAYCLFLKIFLFEDEIILNFSD